VTTEIIRYHRDGDGVVLLTMDDPGRRVNLLSDGFLAALATVVDRLEAGRDAVTGVVLTSAKKTFHAGADLNAMAALDASAAELAARIGGCQRLLRRLERLGRPVVAAVNGAAVGGGYQLALACHHRIALDAPGSLIGLPEAGYGILPDLGGLTRTVRMLGVEAALGTVLLDGRRYPPREAADHGLVDELVTTREQLMARARRWIAGHPGAAQPWDTPGHRVPGPAAVPEALLVRARQAPGTVGVTIVAAAVEGARVDFDTALAVETRYAIELALDPFFHHRMTAVLDSRKLGAGAGVHPAPPRPSGHAGR
jgi:3-hydroxyacyl-CoA dehydrogenase/enoyl-CoA hydratase/3-hydroxybutyryl-CoA epimerase